MSGKSAMSNSIKSNSDQQQPPPPQWIKTQTSTETNVKFAGDEAKDRLYEPKHKKKAVRVLTVIAYVFSVSLAAIMLSLYYMLIYKPRGDGAGGPASVKLRCDGIRSQRFEESPPFDELLAVNLSTAEPPDTTTTEVLTSTAADSSGGELYELASAETNRGPFLSHLFAKYSDSFSNATLYKS